jgi:hypothetical protein
MTEGCRPRTGKKVTTLSSMGERMGAAGLSRSQAGSATQAATSMIAQVGRAGRPAAL